MNTFHLAGPFVAEALRADPASPSPRPTLDLFVAVDGGQDEPTYFPVVAYDELARVIAQHSGRHIDLQGRILFAWRSGRRQLQLIAESAAFPDA